MKTNMRVLSGVLLGVLLGLTGRAHHLSAPIEPATQVAQVQSTTLPKTERASEDAQSTNDSNAPTAKAPDPNNKQSYQLTSPLK
jgi:hypothetical protein